MYLCIFRNEIVEDNWNQLMYYAPWMRTGSYVAGILVGYLLHVTKDKKVLNWVSRTN